MKITEIFFSIQGEGPDVGIPTTFIRVFGCPVHCSWCDTENTWRAEKAEFEEKSVDEILGEVIRLASPNICLTGGEPYYNKQLTELAVRLYESIPEARITIETAVPPCWFNNTIDSVLHHYVWSPKGPSANPAIRIQWDKRLTDRLASRSSRMAVKVVIASSADIRFAADIVRSVPSPKLGVYLQPVTTPSGLDRSLIPEILSVAKSWRGVRILPQIHPYLGVR